MKKVISIILGLSMMLSTSTFAVSATTSENLMLAEYTSNTKTTATEGIDINIEDAWDIYSDKDI